MTQTGVRTTVLLLLISFGHAACQRADYRQRIVEEVMQLEQALNTAMIQGNLTVIERTLADTVVLTTPTGQVATKPEEMAAFAAGETRFEALAADEVRVHLHGPSALVTAFAAVRGQAWGQDMIGRYRYSRLYARSQGALQLVASQWTPVAPVSTARDKIASENAEIITVRPGDTSKTRQGHRQFVGISGATAGARGLSINLVVIPPGAQAEPHRHQGYETAIYVLQGRAETRYGARLGQSVVNEAGDFVYIPPDLPHQPRNLSDTEPVLAIVARNDPHEQENVVRYEPTPTDEPASGRREHEVP